MRIKTISLGLGVEVVKNDLQRAAAEIAKLGESLKPASLGLAMPKLDGSAIGDALGNVGDQLAARLSSALSTVGVGAGQAIASLAPIADRTAGTIISGFRRIDAEITFPRAQAALKGIARVATSISVVGAVRDVIPVAKAASAEVGMLGVKLASHLGDTFKLVWDRGPVMEYWRGVQSRAEEAYKRVEEAQKLATSPRNATGQFVKPGASPTGVISKQDALNIKQFEFLKNELAIATKRVQMLGTALGAMGTVGKLALSALIPLTKAFVGSVVVAGKVIASPLTLIVAGVARVSAAMGRLKNAFEIFGDVAGKTFTKLFGTSNALAVPFQLAIAPARAFGLAVQGTTGLVGTLTTGVKGLGLQIAAAFGAVGLIYKTVQFFKDGVKAASDLNETVSATKQVFGASYGLIEQQVSAIESRFGLLRKSQLDAAAAFGSIAKGAGATEQQAANLAYTFNGLAADFASFKNLTFEDAAAKLRSGLAGESEPLRAYGALITESAVQAQALSMGLGRVAAGSRSNQVQFTELEKVQARAALIMAKLRDAQGDLNRTQGEAANQFRKAGGGVAAFQTAIGGVLLPVVKAGTVAFNEFLAATIDVFELAKPALTLWAETVASAYAFIGKVIRNGSAYWEVSKLKVQEFAINAGRWIMTLPENLANFGSWLGSEWLNLLSDAFNGAITLLSNLGKNFRDFGAAVGEWLTNPTQGFNFDFTPLLDGFQATAAKLPDLVRPELYSVQGEINKILGDVAAKEAARARGMVQPVQQAAAAADAAEAAKTARPEVKLASAVEASSKEAYSAIVTNKAATDPARDAAKSAKEGLAVGKQQLAALNRISEKVGQPSEGPAVYQMGAA